MFARIIGSLVVIGVYELVMILLLPRLLLASGQVAGAQFDNSDNSFLYATVQMGLNGRYGVLPACFLFVALLAIWWGPIARRLGNRTTVTAIAMMLGIGPAQAYYDKTDYTEAYTILPNESAFWIPDGGANKDNQTQFDSETYLNANKVPLKRFIVPHVKLQGSGGFYDFYVPAGRLIIVDRTTYSREWVDATDRGTSKKKEGFPCQTVEGLNITVGMSIGASVTENNAAKYLGRFGVVPITGERTNPAIIFNSVYYSRRLQDVMDDVGRKKVQTLVCAEITARTFDRANAEANKIIETVLAKSTEYFASVGISLDFLGWADTFTFDHDVQDAVNRRYIAAQDKEIAAALAPHADTIQKLAAASALRSFGLRSDGKLPTTIVGLPPDLGGLLGSLLNAGAPPPHPAPPAR